MEIAAARQAQSLLHQTFGPGTEPQTLFVPGRVNLIGEHIDYHSLSVLPMALGRGITLAFRPSSRPLIRAISSLQPRRDFAWTPGLTQAASGDWENYIRAAAEAVSGRWGAGLGIDAAAVSNLPPAAGLSSSSALLIAFTLALLRVNSIHASFDELMEILPDAEHFVGTRGGGMDHAACLGSQAGCASLISFNPTSLTPLTVPAGWGFLAAHSLTHAEKSAAVREHYNSRRRAGAEALSLLGLPSYKHLLARTGPDEIRSLAARLPEGLARDAFLHTAGEGHRVAAAVEALQSVRAEGFGTNLNLSHQSLRDLLRISRPEVDTLVQAALSAGALGARMTGAGFGGCVLIFALKTDLGDIAQQLASRHYSGLKAFSPSSHLINALPSPGALALLQPQDSPE